MHREWLTIDSCDSEFLSQLPAHSAIAVEAGHKARKITWFLRTVGRHRARHGFGQGSRLCICPECTEKFFPETERANP